MSPGLARIEAPFWLRGLASVPCSGANWVSREKSSADPFLVVPVPDPEFRDFDFFFAMPPRFAAIPLIHRGEAA